MQPISHIMLVSSIMRIPHLDAPSDLNDGGCRGVEFNVTVGTVVPYNRDISEVNSKEVKKYERESGLTMKR